MKASIASSLYHMTLKGINSLSRLYQNHVFVSKAHSSLTACSTAHIKVKQSRYTPWIRLGEEEYISYSFTTSTLDGGHARPSFYPRGKDPRCPLDRRLGGPQSRSGRRRQRKNPSPLPGIEPRSPGRPARS
jgi:hypothetical protein